MTRGYGETWWVTLTLTLARSLSSSSVLDKMEMQEPLGVPPAPQDPNEGPGHPPHVRLLHTQSVQPDKMWFNNTRECVLAVKATFKEECVCVGGFE